jgi:hypothetical protein
MRRAQYYYYYCTGERAHIPDALGAIYLTARVSADGACVNVPELDAGAKLDYDRSAGAFSLYRR